MSVVEEVGRLAGPADGVAMIRHDAELVVGTQQQSAVDELSPVEARRSVLEGGAIRTALDDVLDGLWHVLRRVAPGDENGRDVYVQQVHLTRSGDGGNCKETEVSNG